jgi:hypothetical protein
MTMQIRIVRYVPSTSPLIQAFVDIELDGWLRFNGLNYHRDGTLRSAQLTPWRHGKRLYFDAVEILDADLGTLLTTDILAAINAHVQALPPEARVRRVKPPEPKKPEPINRPKPVPPPARLLVGKGGRP